MRVDPLPRITPINITQQPNGYAASLVNVRRDDGSQPTTPVYPTIREAIDAAIELAKEYGYYAV